METGNNDETPTNAPQPPPPLAADDDERSELLFESASEDEAAAATAAETPPREAVADIPNSADADSLTTEFFGALWRKGSSSSCAQHSGRRAPACRESRSPARA